MDGESFLDRVREGSVAYSQEIGEDLKENVYRAMKILAQGFLAETAAADEAGAFGLPSNQQAVARVQENSMRLLYRLLFIFYAESRGLLDVNNRYYYELSLQKLKADVAERLDRDEPLLSVRYSYWESLKNLFSLINGGSESRRIPREEFYIPAYDGGLFDPRKDENRFLESARIGDSFLARAIDLLARSQGRNQEQKQGQVKGQDQSKGRGQGALKQKGFVDYSSLEIRHLGSIYEGLLEYRLRLAEQRMVAVKEKGKELWLPEGEAGKRKVLDRAAAGEIYLVTDKGERKATGSYYTPDYIVKYIVKNTIEPVVEKKKQEWLGTSRPFADYVLTIKVLDPAMGSGHFLVEATDQLARWLVSAWATARPEEADSKEIAEQDIHWARREVVRNCIYGVDLNPMAVELAKLSLWLTTVASNKPLSFLDHHLRCGNSLIGAELDRLTVLPGAAAEPAPLWSFGLKSHTDGLLKKYSLMAALPDDNLQMVKWKEDQFSQIKDGELSRRLAELSNVWLSTYFGNSVKDDDYYELQNHVSPEKFPDWAGQRAQEWFLRAQTLASEKRFFHWELEFPEAFQGEERGFDVVVGNPPYVRQERLGEDKQYFENKFKAYHSIADLYVYFFERGHEVLKNGGTFGFISSNKFMRSNYGEPLRNYLKENVSIRHIIDFGELPVFKEASTFPAIFITDKINSDAPTVYTRIESLDFKSFESIVASFGFQIKLDSSIGASWALSSDDETMIMEKMNNVGDRLGEYVNGNIWRGIVTGLNEAFIITSEIRDRLILEDPNSSDVIKPIIVGDNIRKYVINFDNNYLIYIPWHFPLHMDPTINSASNSAEESFRIRYPAIYNYLLNFKDKLMRRNVSETGIRYEWYALQRFGSDYYTNFKNSKIVYPVIAKESRFALDEDGLYILNDKCFFIPKLDLFLLSTLNSKLAFFYILRVCSILGDPQKKGRAELRSIHLVNLPIRRITFTTPVPERARLGAELKQLYADGKHAEILAKVEACLPKDAQGNFVADREKSDVVHDLLAFLAERMLEMNKQKQQEIRGFLGWMEGYVGAKVEDLTPKTKLQSYYEHDYDSLLAVLKKNRKKLQIDPARREPAEALKAEFEGSMGKLGPLRERIRQTDELIDAVVYKLYGLTEEEIAIVEGKEAAK